MDDGEQRTLFPISECLPKSKPPSRVQQRLIESAAAIASDDPQTLLFQHSVFCQVGLPYRNPGDDTREWERAQGAVALRVEAGRARHPDTGEWVKLGLPWGTKPRLILAHLNSKALKHGSPEIDVGNSLTAFVEHIRGFEKGREIRAFKDQLGRLSAAIVRLAMTKDRRTIQINAQVVTAFDRGSRRTSGSACCGRRPCASRSITSRACRSTPCRSTNGRSAPSRTRRWPKKTGQKKS